MLKRFLQDRGGSVLPLFAVAIVPVIGLVAAAIDYSRATSVRTEMQAALDATALMLSKEATGQDKTALTAKADAYFRAMFNRPEGENVKIAANLTTSDGSALTVSGSGTVPTSFSRLLGFSSIDFASSSTVRWGSAKLQVALALDNTGSMASAGKMSALKTATHQLLTMLQTAAANPGDINVAIIPFAREVNVGANKVAADWIDWTGWDSKNGKWCKKNGQCSDTDQGNAVWTPNAHNTWNGCVMDRTQSYDVRNTTPNINNVDTLFPASQSPYCPVELMPLTSNWTQLNKLVDDMQPNGNTNQAIGLAWAWQALTPGAPLNAPPKPADTQQIIILFTDGLNTQDRWYSDAASIDARQKISCENVKAAGITVYTVQVTTEADPVSTMLKNCASPDTVEPKGPKFFFLTSGSQVVTTFNTIGTSLAKLRISK